MDDILLTIRLCAIAMSGLACILLLVRAYETTHHDGYMGRFFACLAIAGLFMFIFFYLIICGGGY